MSDDSDAPCVSLNVGAISLSDSDRACNLGAVERPRAIGVRPFANWGSCFLWDSFSSRQSIFA